MSNPILQRFEPRELTTDATDTVTDLHARFREFADQLLTITPTGRELAAALTALQEAAFWSTEAIRMTYGTAIVPEESPTDD